MPDELDPDEIVARDRDEWKRLIEKAKPIVEHVLDTLVSDRDVNDPKVKNEIAQQVLPLIADLPNAIERDTYRQMLARRLRVDERALSGAQALPPVLRRKPRQTEAQSSVEAPVVAVTRPGQKIESHALGVLFRKPELCYRLDRLLEEAGLAALSPEDFEYTDHQLFFGIIRQSLEQVEADHHAFVTTRIPEDLLGLATDLLVQTETLDPVDERLLEEVFRNVIKMRRLVVEENFNQLRFIMEDAQQEGGGGDLRIKNYQELAMQYSRLRNNLDRASRKINARK
jgi:DNA primase